MGIEHETGTDTVQQPDEARKETALQAAETPSDSGGDATSPAPESVTLADLAGAHVEAMAGFDPAVHAVDADGNPRRKTDGSFALKRGRKSKGVGEAPQPVAAGAGAVNTSGALPPKPARAKPGQPAPVVGDVPPPVNYRAVAGAAVGAALGIAVISLGDEWRPRDKAEHGGLVDAAAAYLEAQQIQDIPPGWLLLAVVASYAAPRLTAPTTKTRLYAAWERLRGLFKKRDVLAKAE